MVDFNPTQGSEINKIRPAVVVNSDAVGKLPLRMVVPLTRWRDEFAGNLWHVQIDPTKANGLTQVDAADTFQTRSVSIERFRERKGRISASLVREIVIAIAAVIEYDA